MFIDLMWAKFRPSIIRYSVGPYVIYLILFMILTSWDTINYLHNIQVTIVEEAESVEIDPAIGVDETNAASTEEVEGDEKIW